MSEIECGPEVSFPLQTHGIRTYVRKRDLKSVGHRTCKESSVVISCKTSRCFLRTNGVKPTVYLS